MSIFGEYVRAAADKKNLLPDEWLRNAASKAECCNFSTHVGRYSHPDVKTTWQAERNCCPDEPYVSTASADCALDVHGCAGCVTECQSTEPACRGQLQTCCEGSR